MSVLEVQPEGWPASVTVLQTTRENGASAGPFAGFNLGDHVGDANEAVRRNRAQLQAVLPQGCEVSWLTQVHGIDVLRAGAGTATPPEGDGQFTREPLLACAILTADCLPVLLTDRDGQQVAAVHAGWRGLAGGVIERAVATFPGEAGQLRAWLGPCIGPAAFEVGAEVREAFCAQTREDVARSEACFVPAPREGHFLADLPALARWRLQRCGVIHVQTSGQCTFQDAQRYFSYRRDGQTGRMATLIYRRG